jgi:hypothetical protein
MPFKYKKQLNEIKATSPCPATKASEIAAAFKAFRLVKGNVPDIGDFLPPAVMDRARFELGGRSVPCAAYALSYFSTQTQAETHLIKLKRQRVDVDKIGIGEYVACSDIDPNDGLATPPSNTTGHFDFYEYKNAVLETATVTICKVNCG